ncbi:hypothetical protein M422DRAFT_248354 [Sphaerobolus stellatus SS14]|uniref:Uncharacterized protein n=1 Tax=Sphaerobolus stellatus (strain SS14) TaxID=990650 RepID=A0A0C9VIN1_SPHS4|nr:hypothetical protein M422DRAFT_248354 [Sphaerobolus stellatus SS14]
MSYVSRSSRSRSRSLSPPQPPIVVHVAQSAARSDTTSETSDGSESHTTRSRTIRRRSRSRSIVRGNCQLDEVRVVRYVLPRHTAYGNTDQYAISPVPATYNDAFRDSLGILGWYNPQMTFDNTILRLREYLNTNEWAWVDIPPNSWNEIIGPIDEIGLFPKERLPTVSEADFLHGNVTLTYGRSQLSGTHWTETPRNNLSCMNRPASYEEAKASVLQ